MKIAYYIPTFNRSKILSDCLRTCINNTNIKPNELWIIDDGSDNDIKKSLLEFSMQYSYMFPINMIIHGRNYGIGYSFERIYNLMRQDDDLDIACVIESDYIWRKNWLEDCIHIFNSSPYTLAIAGTDHPDMYDRNKTHNIFVDIMKECFGKDLEARQYLYKSFNLNGIELQGVSNSCGCMIIHWKRLKNVLSVLESNGLIPINDYWSKLNRAFNKGVSHDTRKNASDGWMSSVLSMYGEMYLKHIGEDISKHFPMISISDYSISQHVCGGGVNGMIVPEGSTFVISPKWKYEYLDKNPRL